METWRKKETQKQKRLFSIISRGFVTPLQKLAVNSILQSLPHSMLQQDLNKKSILRNLKNIFLINNQHSLKSYQFRNIEKFRKEFFFRLTTFFSGTKRFCLRNNFCSVFYVQYTFDLRKILGVAKKFLKLRSFLFQTRENP